MVVAGALVVHGVSSMEGFGSIIASACQLRLGANKALVGARWLLGWHRRLEEGYPSIQQRKKKSTTQRYLPCRGESSANFPPSPDHPCVE